MIISSNFAALDGGEKRGYASSMRYVALIFVHFLGCSRPFYYVDYHEPANEFSVKVPWGWQLSERGPFSRKPVAEVWWLGKMVAQHEGWPLGVMLFVRKLDRHPDARLRKHRPDFLKMENELFAGKRFDGLTVTTGTFSGYPTRLVMNDDWIDTTGDNWMHGKVKEYPSRLHALVIQTPDEYYILEYRAVREHFESHKPAFDTLVASFKLTKATPPAKAR
jgi:hypothetical protein